jgi:hypothetical protein
MALELNPPNLSDMFGNSLRMDENGIALISAPGKPVSLNGAGVGAAGQLLATLTLTPAQVQALTNVVGGTFVVIPAPGAGLVVVVDKVDVNLAFVSVAYATGTSAASLYYNNAGTLTAIATIIANAQLLQASSSLTDTAGSLTGAQVVANEANRQVVVGLTTNATLYTAGNSPVTITVVYRVIAAA